MTEVNLDKLRVARTNIAQVYEDEAIDETFDNGNLTTLNSALLCVEIVINNLKLRLEAEE